MSERKLRIVTIDDETTEFYLDDKEIAVTTHDFDGWNGMAAVDNALVALAEGLGVEVVRE